MQTFLNVCQATVFIYETKKWPGLIFSNRGLQPKYYKKFNFGLWQPNVIHILHKPEISLHFLKNS